MEGGYERYWTLQDFLAFHQKLLALRQQASNPYHYLQHLQAYPPQVLEPPVKQPRLETHVSQRPNSPSASISDSCGLTSFRSCSVAPFALPSESSSSSCASSSSSPRAVDSTGDSRCEYSGDSRCEFSGSSTSRYGPPFRTAGGSSGSALGRAAGSATCPLDGCATCPVAEPMWPNPERNWTPKVTPRFLETAGERRAVRRARQEAFQAACPPAIKNAVARNGPNLQRLRMDSHVLQQALLNDEPLTLSRPATNILHQNPPVGPFTAEAPGGHGPGYQAGTGERAAEPAGPPEKIIGRKRRLIEAWQREQQM